MFIGIAVDNQHSAIAFNEYAIDGILRYGDVRTQPNGGICVA
jgi:hypothetical protein